MEKVKLGDVCKIQAGGTPSRANLSYWNGDIPWVKISDIKGKYLNKTEEFITHDGLNNSSAKIFEKGTILYTIFATLGEVSILEIEATTNQAIAGLQIVDKNVNQNYLYYYLVSLKSYVNEVGRGVAQNNINMQILRNFEIPLPSLEEQKAIAERLDKVSGLIEKRKTQLEKLDLLIKSRFIEMFGDSEHNTMNWPTVKLSILCDVGSSKRIYQNELTENGIPFLRISDLNERIDGEYNEPQLFIPNERFDELKTNGLVPSAGDILVTARGTLGRCYIVKAEDKFYFQDGMISWLSDISENITSLYISELFATTGIQKQIANLQAGSTVAYLSIAMLKKLDIMMPPKALQQQFETFVEQIDKSKFEIQKSLEKLEILKKSLMQQYFG